MTPRSNRGLPRWTYWGVVFVIVLAVAALLLPYQGFEGEEAVVIAQGMGRKQIAEELTRRGVLASKWPFLLYAYTRPQRTLKAGEYLFNQPLSAVQVFGKLERGEVRLYSLTVPEGWTRWDIAAEAERLQLAPREAFLRAADNIELIRDLAPEAKNLEGYLFPDTYHFARPSDPEHMVRTMVERFRRVFEEVRAGAAPPVQLTPHQQVTLASLIEKETGVPEERGLIAAVFYNRLQQKMVLACDPTVIYAARVAGGGAFDGVINVSDLERKSPYNTYLNAGLPPGPIASPGRAALEAALKPPQSKYLFFVSNTEGGHFFAATSREHERNVVRYRQLRARQQRAGNGK